MALLSSGCGYALAGRGAFLPDYIQVVGIPQLQNASTFFQLEQILTERIRTEFIGRGRYRVVPGPEGADAVITGVISSVGVTPVAFTDQQLANRYQFLITMSMTFTDARTGQPLWTNAALTFREEYDLTLSGTLQSDTFVSQERAAVDRFVTDASRTIVTAILEAF